MKNPFISKTDNGREYLTSNCSLNKVRFAKLPISGIEDVLTGKAVSDVFGAVLLIQDIKEHAELLGIDLKQYKEVDLPKILGEYLSEQDDIQKGYAQQYCENARKLAKKYGNRLGMMLLVLKTGLPENRQAREDWTDQHWEYWKNIKNVILAGGLASGDLGRFLLKTANELFEYAGVEPYYIIRNENSSQIGAKGCLTQVQGKEPVHILLDLGQTKVKRLIALNENGKITLIELESKKSYYMEWQDEKDNTMEKAYTLHQYLVNCIVDTYHEAEKYGKVGCEIIISIASYVIDGRINDKRGGYAKLSKLGDNYAYILSQALEKSLHTNIYIQLIHDGTAAALYFKDYKDSVCITMGTAFGVGFPEIKLLK